MLTHTLFYTLIVKGIIIVHYKHKLALYDIIPTQESSFPSLLIPDGFYIMLLKAFNRGVILFVVEMFIISKLKAEVFLVNLQPER